MYVCVCVFLRHCCVGIFAAGVKSSATPGICRLLGCFVIRCNVMQFQQEFLRNLRRSIEMDTPGKEGMYIHTLAHP